MILIDALYINNSGGKTLLDYLIKSIEQSNIEVFYLLDDRITADYLHIDKNKVLYLKANFKNRFLFYIKNKNKFHKVFCFANIPPPIKLNAKIFTYFHQRLFLAIPTELTLKFKAVLLIKSKIVKYLSRNTDFWIVQTELMKDDLLNGFNINTPEKIKIYPFYPPLLSNTQEVIIRKKNIFIYVSTYNPHKNFENLLAGFKLFYDKNKIGELHLTLAENSGDILFEINKLLTNGYPIINHGFVDREKLVTIYKNSEFLVYPSLSESFGLGIIEGIENGCNVIGANLPYTTAVCIPSLLFNPYSVDSIADAFESAVLTEIKKTEQLVFNEINSLLKLLN
jgi:glycosyltransferase involved in cell wall biosynthesis